MTEPRRATLVVALGAAQMLAWASSYYLPAVLAAPMAADLGISTAQVFAGFSLALLVAALTGPWLGRAIDRWGGRLVLMAASVVFAAALAGMGCASGPATLWVAWVVMGLAMGGGLYEAAFAALVRLYGHDARNAITGITLFGGLASTVGWPMTLLLEDQWGWRGACLTWAALHLLVGLRLNACLPRARHAPVSAAAPPAPATPDDAGPSTQAPATAAVLLAFVFAATWFISTAMAAHLPRLLQAGGVSLAGAVAMGALVGPAQVAGRLLEFGLLRHLHPLLSARLAAALHPLGASALMLAGAPAAALFAILHGAGNGVLTIAKGTLPLALFGAHGYGHRQGWLMAPARIAQAVAPWLFGLCLDRWGVGALAASGALGLLVLVALLLLRAPRTGLH